MNKTLARAALIATAALSPLLTHAQDAGGLPPVQPAPPQQVNTVPEPGSLVLAAMALGASLALRRRRAQRGSDRG